MSSIWYEYLEETGGEIIPLNNFSHVYKSFEKVKDTELVTNCSKDEIRFAYNYEAEFWWPISITDQLSEGWIKLEYHGIDSADNNNNDNNNLWCDLKSNKKSIKSIKFLIEQKSIFKSPADNCQSNIEPILEDNKQKSDIELQFNGHNQYQYQTIKIGAYLECWLENSVGFVWPVKVLSNIGGRLKLVWFGCDSTAKQSTTAGTNNNNNNSSNISINCSAFSMFYLDYRLHSLGWARLNGWKYSPPSNVGINIAISNVDTFVRGSPTAFPAEISCNRPMREHFFEEGWQLEAVNPLQPWKIHVATIRYVLDRTYFLVELDQHRQQQTNGLEQKQPQPPQTNGVGSGNGDSIMFAGFAGMAELLPANTSSISGYSVEGLRGANWEEHLLLSGATGGPAKYAPHLGYFRNNSNTSGGGVIEGQRESAFQPGCKLEAVVPWNRHALHAATVVRVMDGSRLVWLRSDCDSDAGDWLVDPTTSTEIFPAGWAELVGHPLVMPPAYGAGTIGRSLCGGPPLDPDDIAIELRPHCFLGPFISRSLAAEILPCVVGPGHCVPVFRALFHLLLKVSHKPYKLMRRLQLDSDGNCYDLMATIGVPSPKSEWGCGRVANKRADWLIQVAVRKRAVSAFCRQTALEIGACPSFISSGGPSQQPRSLCCEARLAAKAGEKMSAQRRKRLLLRPLTALGISYRELRSRGAFASSNSGSCCSNSDVENNSSDNRDEQQQPQLQLPPATPSLCLLSESMDAAVTGETSIKTVSNTNVVTLKNRFAANVANGVESRMCTRGMRLVVPDGRLRRQQNQRAVKRRSATIAAAAAAATTTAAATANVKVRRESVRDAPAIDHHHRQMMIQQNTADEDEEAPFGRNNGTGGSSGCVSRAATFDVRDYVIDPVFLAGDIERVTLASNPLHWSVEQLTDYLAGTDCRQLISWLANEKVDGRAFLLLTLPVLSTLYGLQLELAIRLCRHVVSLKRVFVEQYADMQQLLLPDDI